MKKFLLSLLVVSFSFSIGIDKFAHFGMAYLLQDVGQKTINIVTTDVQYSNDVSLVLVNIAGIAKEVIIDSQLDYMDLVANAAGSGLAWIVNGGVLKPHEGYNGSDRRKDRLMSRSFRGRKVVSND